MDSTGIHLGYIHSHTTDTQSIPFRRHDRVGGIGVSAIVPT